MSDNARGLRVRLEIRSRGHGSLTTQRLLRCDGRRQWSVRRRNRTEVKDTMITDRSGSRRSSSDLRAVPRRAWLVLAGLTLPTNQRQAGDQNDRPRPTAQPRDDRAAVMIRLGLERGLLQPRRERRRCPSCGRLINGRVCTRHCP